MNSCQNLYKISYGFDQTINSPFLVIEQLDTAKSQFEKLTVNNGGWVINFCDGGHYRYVYDRCVPSEFKELEGFLDGIVLSMLKKLTRFFMECRSAGVYFPDPTIYLFCEVIEAFAGQPTDELREDIIRHIRQT